MASMYFLGIHPLVSHSCVRNLNGLFLIGSPTDWDLTTLFEAMEPTFHCSVLSLFLLLSVHPNELASHWCPISVVPKLAPMHHSFRWSSVSLFPQCTATNFCWPYHQAINSIFYPLVTLSLGCWFSFDCYWIYTYTHVCCRWLWCSGTGKRFSNWKETIYLTLLNAGFEPGKSVALWPDETTLFYNIMASIYRKI